MTTQPTALATTVLGSGPALLLAHGASGSAEANYSPLLPGLAKDHTVIAPDYPGSGATPRATEPLTIDGLADAVLAAADAAGARTFTLIGYSLGTLVSVRIAARHPERVTGLVLTAGIVKPDNRLLATVEVWRRLLEKGDLDSFARFTALTGFSEEFFNGLPSDQVEQFYRLVRESVPAGTPDQAGAVATADVSADLSRITAPTLVICPTGDALVSPAQSRRLADGIAGAEYVEIPTGHVVMAERPAAWQRLIEDFLRRHGL
ncbi:alpha/beta fold hydrolase [Streptomyces sp. SAJ15]|uniref:alpha/beta fold hydrolase n=1 Tax=Streptomyces sp. SAJ15 TaxID=2011095 RepID=UPI001184A0D9|nr:alpha/beta hydrolase [Streptomyces sp. SAJ15]TVL90158.1 alpha/beta hydrolase [Streptomyces sp. SAJ15]